MIISRKTTFLTLILALLALIVPQEGTYAAKTKNASSESSYPEISREEYINRYKHIAIAHQRRYGIPASITMAQGILESNSGNSNLARKSNNHFGIKCKGDWKGRSVRHDDDAPNECFRAYDTVERSYEDHAEFLDSSPRYDSLFRFDPTDYSSWARGLKAAGYATAPDYAPRLVKIIEDYKLYLLDREEDGEGEGERAYLEATTSLPRESIEERARQDLDGIDPNNFRITVNTVNGYNLYRTNQALYVVAKEGDSYRTIARLFDCSTSTLRKFNDIKDSSITLEEGDVVYLEKKKSHWMGNTRQHTMRRGESLYSISQSYGIRLSSLRRLNKLKGEVEPSEGTTISLK